MMENETPKSLDAFLGLLGEIDMIKDQVSSLDKDTHIILAHDEVSSMMGNSECFRILKLIETLNANICGLNASILNAAEHIASQHSDKEINLDIKKNEQAPEIMLEDEEVVSKMNEMIEKEMQKKSTDKEDKKDNEVINNMLEYFKERFENGRE